MNIPDADDRKTWSRIVDSVTAELADLPGPERAWLLPRLRGVEQLQVRLHALFEKADGARLCSDCEGACCARGKHHLTLANLLGILLAGRQPPEPDFSVTCPFLGREGCLLEAGHRPFNCVTFLCEAVEERLGPADRTEFYALESELRACYEEFENRYAGAGLRGLMIRSERLGERPFLSKPDPHGP